MTYNILTGFCRQCVLGNILLNMWLIIYLFFLWQTFFYDSIFIVSMWLVTLFVCSSICRQNFVYPHQFSGGSAPQFFPGGQVPQQDFNYYDKFKNTKHEWKKKVGQWCSWKCFAIVILVLMLISLGFIGFLLSKCYNSFMYQSYHMASCRWL